MVLFDRAAAAQFMGSMLILDRSGDIIYDSGANPARKANFADRDYFKSQLHKSDSTFVSAPYKSRLRAGDPSIALSRRLDSKEGGFDGVVMAAVRIQFFEHMLSQINLGPKSVMAITLLDGTVILREPSTDGAGNIGFSVASSPIFQRMLKAPGVPFSHASVFDGVERYYLSARVEGFPLLLSVGISTDAAMQQWRDNSTISSALTVSMCVLLGFLVRSLKLALIHSKDVEAQLERLAATDKLTGLPNRRAFDLKLEMELVAASHGMRHLSILLIDIDHFKQINDKFGHSVGDVILARCANRISRLMRMERDFAARYGGEEFVAILPSTDVFAAMAIAERIRSAVAEMTPLPADPGFRITVSIGVAGGIPRRDDLRGSLLEQADKALYEAKNSGRNRVCLFQSVE